MPHIYIAKLADKELLQEHPNPPELCAEVQRFGGRYRTSLPKRDGGAVEFHNSWRNAKRYLKRRGYNQLVTFSPK